jgi:CheY-like chemotaxis protein
MARVLLVEDDATQREIRQLVLEAAGHQVSAAASFEEALERSPGCELMVLDLIPNSIELLAAIAPEIRVIVLSGREIPLGSFRADAILQKPCTSRKLLAAIAQFCLFLYAFSASAESFKVVQQAEMIAELDLRAAGTDWGNPARPAVLATVLLDGKEQQNIMLYAGAERFTYRIFLGKLDPGQHNLKVEGAAVEMLAARFREDQSDVLAHAPILFARPNTIGKFTDIPLITYCEKLRESGFPMLQYTVIYSNEDGGTSTRALMARWGRTTDIEWVYKVFLNSDGSTHHAIIQAAAHRDLEFQGKREGSHPLLLTATENNNVAFDRTSPVRYQIPPVLVDLSQHSREQVMDERPFAYSIMSKELAREEKLRPFGVEQDQNVSDPRNYLFIEAKVANHDSALGFLIRLQGDHRWYSGYVGRADYAITRDGWVRGTVELPPGTRAEQIAEVGFQCLVAEKKISGTCEVVSVSKTFFLDSGYKPGPAIWTLQEAQRIPTGQTWTFSLR